MNDFDWHFLYGQSIVRLVLLSLGNCQCGGMLTCLNPHAVYLWIVFKKHDQLYCLKWSVWWRGMLLEGATDWMKSLKWLLFTYIYVLYNMKGIFKNKMKFTHFNFHLYGKLLLVWLLAMVQSFERVDRTVQTLQHECCQLGADMMLMDCSWFLLVKLLEWQCILQGISISWRTVVLCRRTEKT